MKCKCSMCKEPINDRGRIVVSTRYLGAMNVLENMHISCWEKLVTFYRREMLK